MYRITNVNTNKCTKNPTVVGYPSFDEIGPINPPSIEFTDLNANGLKSKNKTKVVNRVYFHLSKELSCDIIYKK